MNISIRDFAERLVGNGGPRARAFENLIFALILISVLSVLLEATVNLPGWATEMLRIVEIVIVAVFYFEYLLRLATARRKLAFVFSFYGLVALLSIARYYLVGLDVRYLRVLRLLRLLRIVKLQRRVLKKKLSRNVPANSRILITCSSRRTNNCRQN